MKTGTFAYVGFDGRTRYLRVRECPNPEVARRELEAVVESPVRWQEATPRPQGR